MPLIVSSYIQKNKKIKIKNETQVKYTLKPFAKKPIQFIIDVLVRAREFSVNIFVLKKTFLKKKHNFTSQLYFM